MCTTTALNDLGLTDKNHHCSCSTDSHTDSAAHDNAAQPRVDAIREHYLVDGMTCSHCVASVTKEVSAMDGVESVSVDLHAGGTSRIMVVSSKPVPVDDIRDAITEAGYELATA